MPAISAWTRNDRAQAVVTTLATLYTVQANESLTEIRMTISNQSATLNATTQVYFVLSGASAGDVNHYGVDILTTLRDLHDLDYPISLNAGDTIQVSSDNAVSVHVGGKVMTIA